MLEAPKFVQYFEEIREKILKWKSGKKNDDQDNFMCFIIIFSPIYQKINSPGGREVILKNILPCKYQSVSLAFIL